MFKIVSIAIFIWLLVKAIGLAFKLTWGVAKIIAGILMIIALPGLIVCLLFAGTFALLAPIALIAIAVLILRACL